MSFRISGLDPVQFRHLVGLSDVELAAYGVTRCVVDGKPGFPDRVEVRDLDIGETALLLNYEHQPENTAYRSRHAIFVGETSRVCLNVRDKVPDAIQCRTISLRAFTAAGEMIEADLCEGNLLPTLIERFFHIADVAYLHAHYAKRGCYAARIDRS